jgi:hypothetical protein
MPCAYRFFQMRDTANKGQGRIQRGLMTHTQKVFLFPEGKFQASIPGTSGCGDWETLSRFLNPLVPCVARGDLGDLASQNI